MPTKNLPFHDFPPAPIFGIPTIRFVLEARDFLDIVCVPFFPKNLWFQEFLECFHSYLQSFLILQFCYLLNSIHLLIFRSLLIENCSPFVFFAGQMNML